MAGRSPASLLRIPGVGEGTAGTVVASARTLVARLAAEPVDLPRVDSWDNRDTQRMTKAAWALLDEQKAVETNAALLDAEGSEVQTLATEVAASTRLRDWARRRISATDLAEARKYAERSENLVRRLRHFDAFVPETRRKPKPPPLDELEQHFRDHYAAYAAVFDQALGRLALGDTASPASAPSAIRGPSRGLPAELATRIEAHPLDTHGLRVTLRRYQEFGTKYLLAQHRTLLGDEMGLGKTIQALAAFVHLHNADGHRHFLVVCPASIIQNWLREIRERAPLPPQVLHGPGRDQAVTRWLAGGYWGRPSCRAAGGRETAGRGTGCRSRGRRTRCRCLGVPGRVTRASRVSPRWACAVSLARRTVTSTKGPSVTELAPLRMTSA